MGASPLSPLVNSPFTSFHERRPAQRLIGGFLTLSLMGSLALLSAGFCKAGSGAVVCLPYEPATVSLTGTLTSEEKLGPPGYGETPDVDRKMTIFVLRLDAPIDTCGQPGGVINFDSLKNVTEVQVYCAEDLDCRQYLARKLTVAGTLEQAILGAHFKPVVARVSKVRPT